MLVIGVRFRKAGKIYFFDPGGDVIEKGDYIIVETARGLECGQVVIGLRELPESEMPVACGMAPIIRRIHRKATKADMIRLEENRNKEQEAFEICLQKISAHKLPMKLINVNYTFDVNKIIFYFTAEGRVDFRELVRDLASIFHTRIELRQVGVRDEAKVLGGTGCCGRPLCCSSFLGDFAPVSIKMAKEQNLSLNPAKISGICGRLLCCLKYESDYYHEQYMANFKSFQPESGDRVILDEGEGRIVAVNVLNKTATVALDNRKTVTANWEDILPVEQKPEKKTEKKAEEVADEEKIVAEPPKKVESTTRQNNFHRQKNFHKNSGNHFRQNRSHRFGDNKK